MAKIEFSQTALEQMNRGAPNFALTGVKASWTWFLFGSLSLFFAALIFWGFYGSMVETVAGTGITLLEGGVYPIVAGGGGTISHLNIRAGSPIEAQTTVGQIYNPEMFFRLSKSESEYRLLDAEITLLETGTQKLTAQKVAVEKEKKAQLEKLAVAHAAGKSRAGEVADIYARLKKEGASSRVEYYRALDQMLQTETTLISTVLQSLSSEVETAATLWTQEQTLLQLRQQREQKESEWRLAEKTYRESYWLRTDFTGRVMEVFKQDGDYVQPGERVALVGIGKSNEIFLAAYVPAERSKKIRNGMSAFFSPASLSASEFGYLKGVVSEVGEAPVDADAVVAELMNKNLTQMITGKTAVVRIVVKLLPDAKTANGFQWTSKNGAAAEINNGMLGTVTINTDYRPPASYIIPGLRHLLLERQPPAALEE